MDGVPLCATAATAFGPTGNLAGWGRPRRGIPWHMPVKDPDEYLLPTERRVIRVRRHWSVVARDVVMTAALVALAIMVSRLLPSGLALARDIVWYGGLLAVLRLAYKLYQWWDEILVVTDKRFVLASGVFTTKIAMMPLAKVTDLTYERTAGGRMFGYGALVIESAGRFQAFNRIDHLPRPELVYDAISQLVFGAEQSREERFSMLRAQRLAGGRRMVA